MNSSWWMGPRSRFQMIRLGLAVMAASLLSISPGTMAKASALQVGAEVDGGPRYSTAGKDGRAMSRGEVWQEVDRLVDDQQFEAASRRVGEILVEARKAGDEENWTRALIRTVQLRTALHGYATAVRFLATEEWPSSPGYRVVLDLFRAQGLHTYLQAYSWEISQRERVDTGEEVDLKVWTRDQIAVAVNQAFLEAWLERESWGSRSIGELAEYIEQNDYPARIRGTLRDAVTYLWVEALADTSLWRPEHESGVYRLDLEALLAADGGRQNVDLGTLLADRDSHPLRKIVVLLADLEAWHSGGREPEAAFEARLERLRRLGAAFTQTEDQRRIRSDLERRLDDLGRGFPWWSMGMAELARGIRNEERPESLIEARETALAGERAHPASLGGERCRHLVAAIEAPGYQLSAMSTDGPGRRSILVHHQNLERLHFRAYAFDLRATVEAADDYNILPSYRDLPEILAGSPPQAAWSVDLPATLDYRSHRTFVEPPLTTPGLYIIVASAREDFAERLNRRAAVNLILSDLVLLTRNSDRGIDITVRSGRSGNAIAGVAVSLLHLNWRQGHREVAREETGADGGVRFTPPGESRDSYFVMAQRGDDIAIDEDTIYRVDSPARAEQRAALIYTDRTVYRPGQTLHWKVVAYAGVGPQGKVGVESSVGAEGAAVGAAALAGRFVTLPGTEVEVRLLDGNGEEVEARQVRTNDFGSIAGEFEIPTGRLLGGWRLATSLGGSAAVRVEEYKRPTFEVSIDDPDEPLRLNRGASLHGSARYYFGLPVTAGSVSWQVVRESVYPRWWWGFRRRPRGGAETVAAGDATLASDGTFTISFSPEADERSADERFVTYRFRLTAALTDEGGETRSASRSFRLGFVAVEAAIEFEGEFLRAGHPVALPVRRSDLDGLPRAGDAGWRLVTVVQPDAAQLPADQPLPPQAAEVARFATEGDDLRPRWATDYTPESVMRLWEDGGEVAEGTLHHDDAGRAEIRLPHLPAGLYRLHYWTEDPFGALFETSRDLVVAAAGASSGAAAGPSRLALPAVLWIEESVVPVGGVARLLVSSALGHYDRQGDGEALGEPPAQGDPSAQGAQEMELEILRPGRPVERRRLTAEEGLQLLEIPVSVADRGGIAIRLTVLRDHQLMILSRRVTVPWDDRRLEIELATFRDRLRPGQSENWRVVVRGSDEAVLDAGTAEILAYMYDRSLDIFAAHTPPQPLSIYPKSGWLEPLGSNLGQSSESWSTDHDFAHIPRYPVLIGDRLRFFDGYSIGGPGLRMRMAGGVQPMAVMAEDFAAEAPARVEGTANSHAEEVVVIDGPEPAADEPPVPEDPVELRTDFAETAFWEPHLLIDGEGAAVIEFTVPDSVTEWNFWVHAMTRDLRSGSLTRRVRTIKELMVRPYLPRFLREGDLAELRVAVNNAGETDFAGTLDFEVIDAESEESLAEEFGLSAAAITAVPFSVAAGAGTSLAFTVETPVRVGAVAVRVTARAGGLGDGELRPLPILPGRMHLVQSRFAALQDADSRRLEFADMAADDDRSRIDEQLVVTLDGQLFVGVLRALPYLVTYPYSCTEQTLNRFLSTGILASLYDRYPAVKRMAEKLADRPTRLEPWAADDPNRKMALVETPWLAASRGGDEAEDDLLNVLDPEIAGAQRRAALAELEKAQTSLGAFPWWPGGPPSPYMTLYLLDGFSRALEFDVEVPQQMVVAAWSYMHRHYLDEMARRVLEKSRQQECCWELITYLNYVLSSYPDISWTGGVFSDDDRRQMLEFSFAHWREHSPRLKGYLALTLHRAGRDADARRIFDSVMDSAKTDRDLGTYWAPEAKAWLWYNDTIETHAAALRTLSELDPMDSRRHGLVQWLFLNKKLNHWKSTRATAEVVYSLVHYLRQEDTLEAEEAVRVTIGDRQRTYTFRPDSLAPEVAGTSNEVPGTSLGGRPNQWVVPGREIDPATMSTILIEKETPGFLFASATWHFSTERLPDKAEGDLFSVIRRYYRRVHDGREWTLQPLADGTILAAGDQVEVALTIRARHAAEYVHLRDPRPAGLEPQSLASGYRWQGGLGMYEEVRDSGAEFFIDWLPAGEYTLRYRLRASLGGTYRAAPAVLQSMYAPEFTAYSSGRLIEIGVAPPEN